MAIIVRLRKTNRPSQHPSRKIDEMPPTNPYLTDGRAPQLRKSLVAFLDILGFSSEMEAAFKERSASVLLKRLRDALDKAWFNLTDEYSGLGPVEVNSWHVKAFTDNIVIGYPIRDADAEWELGTLLLAIREYQIAMVNSGFFIRGAIAIGDAYLDNEIVFGDALIEAYKAEQTLARDPRIVLAASIQPFIDRQLKFYSDPRESPHNDVLLKDVDGQLFVNYLGTIFDEVPKHARIAEVSKHKLVVERNLRKHKDRPTLWSKYAWIANYHDFICREQGGQFLNFQIDSDLLQTTPARLFRPRG
jgi:hypothetical protein